MNNSYDLPALTQASKTIAGARGCHGCAVTGSKRLHVADFAKQKIVSFGKEVGWNPEDFFHEFRFIAGQVDTKEHLGWDLQMHLTKY